VTHPPVDAPLCLSCQQLDLAFFDPSCPGCGEILRSRETSIGQILGIMRQWVPQTQHNIDNLILEVLKRGAHPDDRDSLTDMTLIMYACKAGASGVGDVQSATRITEYLLSCGADTSARCRWTNMTALHYATYFDVAPVLVTLLHHTNSADVDTVCVEYENGSALHIAASNLSLGAARVLLKFGADLDSTDDLGRTPRECIPDASNYDLIPDAQELISKMEKLLSEGLLERTKSPNSFAKTSTKSISGRTVLQAMGLKVNDRVVVAGNKLGTLRFCGTTEFAMGMWAGVELDSAEGKNDGTVKGMRYFRCEPEHGIFVPSNKVAKAGRGYKSISTQKKQVIKPVVNYGKVDVSHVQAKFHTAMSVIAEKAEIRVGDRVMVKEVAPGKGCKGVIRFVGSVDFVDDMTKWYGVELDDPLGRHDGTVQQVRYFAASKDHGVFVTVGRLSRLDSDDNYNDSVSQCESISNASTVGGRPLTSTPTAKVRRSLSMKHHETKSASISVVGSERAASTAFSRSYSVRHRSNDREAPPDWQSVSGPVYNKFKKKENMMVRFKGEDIFIANQARALW